MSALNLCAYVLRRSRIGRRAGDAPTCVRWNIWIGLAGTLALALLVLLLPLRGAVRFRPGDALRYA